ncbi:protease inhibitor I42 family protein [Streptomyces sp. NPDC100445]|uniref:protease inhibitor I42 family protein n=1 Tax=Streptomyces sp. NPDC100445 TaxID=3366102 RepID=UPI003802711B
MRDTGITAAPGERFTLTVDQNASTREYWYLVGPRPDSAVLVSRGRHYASETGDEPAAGAGGRLTFTFEAKGRGTTRFTLPHRTFTTCRGNTSTVPPASAAEPSATPTSPLPGPGADHLHRHRRLSRARWPSSPTPGTALRRRRSAGSLSSNPALLAGAAGIMAQLAMQRPVVLADMVGVDLMVGGRP